METISNSFDEQGAKGQKKLFRIPGSKRGKIFLAITGGLALAVLLTFTVFFGDFIGTRAIGFSGPRTSVRQGEIVSLKYVTQQGLMGRSVEICSKALLSTSCKALIFKVSPNASTIDVAIPVNHKLGKADLRLVGIYGNGARVVLGLRAVMVQPYVAQNTNGGSGGGGGNGGGSSSGSSDSSSSSTPTPTPPLPYGPY